MAARVLIAEDTAVMRSLIRMALESAGFSIVGEASSGEDAVRLYQELKPDLVTLDLALEGMDGLQCLREIRAADPGARFVVVTALGAEPRIKEALALGVADFVVKPFQPDRLIAAVRAALGT